MSKFKRYLSALIAVMLLLASFPLFVSAEDMAPDQTGVAAEAPIVEPFVAQDASQSSVEPEDEGVSSDVTTEDGLYDAESKFASELSAEPQLVEDESGAIESGDLENSSIEDASAESGVLAAGTIVPNDTDFNQDIAQPDATEPLSAAATVANEDISAPAPVTNPETTQETETAEPTYTSFTYEDEDLALKAYVSDDSWFGTSTMTVSPSMLELTGTEEDSEPFANLADAYEGEVRAVDLAFQMPDGEELEQLSGTTYLAMRIPTEDEHAVIEDVQVYRDAEDGTIERIEDVYVNKDDAYVLFDAGAIGSYALCYTVDYYYEDQEYHMYGGTTMLLSELFDQLGIHRDAADVEAIDFTDESLIRFTRRDDDSDWVIESLAPFNTEEALTLTFADGYKLRIDVTDEGQQQVSSDLKDFMTDWKIKVGDTVYSDDTWYEGMEIEYTDGMVYTLELRFAEKPGLAFNTPAYDASQPAPTMTYELPRCFVVPSDFTTTLNVNLGIKGTLPNNIISITNRLEDDGYTHSYLTVTWNWADSHWKYFLETASAKLKIVVNGTFTGKDPDKWTINDKEITIRRADLHNAIVNKTGELNKSTNEIYYTVTVTSQGTTSDITLTDELGSALTYLYDGAHGGGIAYDETASINTAGTEPIITPHSGNTFYVQIPNMNDEDELVFHYYASVDYDKIEMSGNPTFEETGNTAQIFGDNYDLDNVAKYHETDIAFSDLEKNCIDKERTSIDGNEYYDLTWEIKTNRLANYPLAGSDVTDTIAENIQSITHYSGEGVTVECYDDTQVKRDERQLSWADLGVNTETAKSWTYPIPETDPNYCYVLTYHTLVDMSERKTIIATNAAEGKGGVDSDTVVLVPSGNTGFGIEKKATNVTSTGVTWEIRLTVSGSAFGSSRICLTEHSDTTTDSNGDPTWSRDMLPYRGWTIDGETIKVKEHLKKVEIEGLVDDETFVVTYGRNRGENDTNTHLETYTSTTPTDGKTVLEANFWENTWDGDYCQLEFFQDANQQTGGLVNPGGESPTRTIIIRLTTEFSDKWAPTAQKVVNASAKRTSYDYEHVNWISVDTPNANNKLIPRAKNTDKIMPMPPHVNKMVLRNQDTTDTKNVKKEFFILDYPNAKAYPNADTPYDLIVNWQSTAKGTDPQYAGLPSYPAFHYMVYVTGVEYDEPIVIEDTFDTSLFELVTSVSLPAGMQVITETSRKWTHEYFPAVFGMSAYRNWYPDSNFVAQTGGTYSRYKFGFDLVANKTNGPDTAEKHNCTLELTETGFKITIKEPFKQADGSLYPYYGIDYWLIPKDLDALKTIEQTAKANALATGQTVGKASYTNTAKCRLTEASATVKIGAHNDFVPLDKTSEAYLKLLDGSADVQLQKDGAGKYVTPAGVSSDNIKHYVMRYTITLNKGGERLNDGNPITVEDSYCDRLSVDFHSIQVTTVPEGRHDDVSYDFSGNVGTFIIPDETQVTIVYDATILQTGASDDLKVDNTVKMLNYSKTLTDDVQYAGASESEGETPLILLKKYGSGHMERGLNGARFQLYEYNNGVYNKTSNNSNSKSDWTPVMRTKGGTEVFFETEHLEIGGVDYGDGYALIQLTDTDDGMNLTRGKTYGLHEVTPPTYKISDDPDRTDDIITYKEPNNDDTFFCYVFTICAYTDTADYDNYVFFNQDTMTVRNTPESTTLHMNKEIEGNAKDLLTDADKNCLWYQLYRKHEEGNDGLGAVYMPIMTHDDVNNEDIVDPRFSHITYAQMTGGGSGGLDIAGLIVEENASVGEYLLVEYGNDVIRDNHPDWTWHGSYRWDDDTEGSFTTSAFTVYDEYRQQVPGAVQGVEFTITSQEVKDGTWKKVTIVNTYDRETVNLTAEKRWVGPTGLGITWPHGKQVKLELGYLDGDADNPTFVALTDVPHYQVTLDDVADVNGEAIPGQASWRGLPKYKVVEVDGHKEKVAIRYAVSEVDDVEGYTVVYPQIGNHAYAEFDGHGDAVIKNQVESTSISVSKMWNPMPQTPAKATFRLYAYAKGDDPSNAYWVYNVNDIELDGLPDAGESTFGEKVAWQADFTGLPRYDSNGVELVYIVKELSCTPANYEPVEEYAANGGSITNKPASTTFTVRKAWSDTPNDAWPEGYNITFVLGRRTRSGSVDSSFSATYVVSATELVSQTPIVNMNGVSSETASWNDSVLSVAELPKYDNDGNEWLYFARETAAVDEDNASVMDLFARTYRDKNNLPINEDRVYSDGSVTNVYIARDLALSKIVEGNMGDRTKEFTFTITLTKSNGQPYNHTIVVEDSSGTPHLETINGIETVTLRHGETITLKDLPSSLSYTIVESEVDAADYMTSYTVNGGAVTSGRIAEGTLANNTSVAFANMRTVILPTGVYIPGGFVFGTATFALQGIWLARRHRRREDDTAD